MVFLVILSKIQVIIFRDTGYQFQGYRVSNLILVNIFGNTGYQVRSFGNKARHNLYVRIIKTKLLISEIQVIGV